MKDSVKEFEVLGVYYENSEFHSISLGQYQFGVITLNEMNKIKVQNLYFYILQEDFTDICDS